MNLQDCSKKPILPGLLLKYPQPPTHKLFLPSGTPIYPGSFILVLKNYNFSALASSCSPNMEFHMEASIL